MKILIEIEVDIENHQLGAWYNALQWQLELVGATLISPTEDEIDDLCNAKAQYERC